MADTGIHTISQLVRESVREYIRTHERKAQRLTNVSDLDNTLAELAEQIRTLTYRQDQILRRLPESREASLDRARGVARGLEVAIRRLFQRLAEFVPVSEPIGLKAGDIANLLQKRTADLQQALTAMRDRGAIDFHDGHWWLGRTEEEQKNRRT